jgi:hypothetical protein
VVRSILYRTLAEVEMLGHAAAFYTQIQACEHDLYLFSVVASEALQCCSPASWATSPATCCQLHPLPGCTCTILPLFLCLFQHPALPHSAVPVCHLSFLFPLINSCVHVLGLIPHKLLFASSGYFLLPALALLSLSGFALESDP